jgi:hypothetical protein
MDQWDIAVENVRAHDLADTLERYTHDGWEIVSVVVQEYVETTNVSQETGTEQKALVAALYHVFAKKYPAARDVAQRVRPDLSH